ncbi:MAG: DUF4123 domain-containing protein [Sedimenticola sp.]
MSIEANITNKLFSQAEYKVYAVLDGASVPGLPKKLEGLGVHHSCLFTGQLDIEIQQVAPYMARLDKDEAFTNWLLEKGWGKHWGIYLTAPDYIAYKDVRRHLRDLTQVRDPEGKVMFFRYYDPRVFRVFAPSCDEEEYKEILGPFSRVLLEGEEEKELVIFSRESGKMNMQQEKLM